MRPKYWSRRESRFPREMNPMITEIEKKKHEH